MAADTDDTDKSDAFTQKSDDFTRSTRKTPKRLPLAVIGKPQTAVADIKINDEITGLRSRSPAESKEAPDAVSGDKKLASTKPKVTRQRVMEIGKSLKLNVGRMKPVESVVSLNRKTSAAGDGTEKKQPGRPPDGSKMEDKIAIKKKLVIEKKSTAPSATDLKRTGTYVLVEKVDAHKMDKPSVQKRVHAYCHISCDYRWSVLIAWHLLDL